MDTMEKDGPAFVGKLVRGARKARKAAKSKRLERRIAKREARGKDTSRLKAKKGVVDSKRAKLQSRDDRREARKDARTARKVAHINKRNERKAARAGMSSAERKANRRAKLKGARKVMKAAAGKAASAGKKAASITPVGKAVKAVKKAAPKVGAAVKKKINKAATAVAGSTAPGMYDGPGGQETPKLGRMSMGPGMYGKGSKISYGNYHKPTYQKGSAGSGKSPFSMNSAQKIHKHMKGRK
tara:strand:- start:708 stop:1430 length:723 start_codon:yes stop_codon:yes gene_type:complete